MAKKLLKIAGVVVALLILALVIVYFFAGSIIRPIVASTATSSLGVPTSLGGADLRAFAGNLTLSDLAVSNPKAFDTLQFATFKTCSVTVEPSSLLGSTVKIDDITIDGLSFTIEQNGMESNIGDIMKNLNAASGTSQGGSKQLDIGKVILTNIAVHVRAGGIPGIKAQGFDITLPRLEIDRPMDPNGRLPKLANLMGQILATIAQQAAKDPHMPQELQSIFGSAASFGGNFTKNLQQGLQNATKGLGGTLNGLGNMFGGKKDKDK